MLDHPEPTKVAVGKFSITRSHKEKRWEEENLFRFYAFWSRSLHTNPIALAPIGEAFDDSVKFFCMNMQLDLTSDTLTSLPGAGASQLLYSPRLFLTDCNPFQKEQLAAPLQPDEDYMNMSDSKEDED